MWGFQFKHCYLEIYDLSTAIYIFISICYLIDFITQWHFPNFTYLTPKILYGLCYMYLHSNGNAIGVSPTSARSMRLPGSPFSPGRGLFTVTWQGGVGGILNSFFLGVRWLCWSRQQGLKSSLSTIVPQAFIALTGQPSLWHYQSPHNLPLQCNTGVRAVPRELMWIPGYSPALELISWACREMAARDPLTSLALTLHLSHGHQDLFSSESH